MTKWLLLSILLVPALALAKKEKPMEWKGQHGGPIDPVAEVIADESGWTRLWLQIGQDAPDLDFKKYYAVAVFAGEKPTGGYTIEFVEPARKGADAVVKYKILPPSGFSTQAIAQPWKVRAFPRVSGKVSVEALGAPRK